MFRRLAALAALTLVALVAVPTGADAATVPLDCHSHEVTGPVTYRLRHDLTCPEAINFFGTDLRAHPQVVIDLGGHTLAAEAPIGCSVFGGYQCTLRVDDGPNLTVRNGTIIGGLGVSYQSSLTVAKVHVTGVLGVDIAGGDVRHSVIDGPIACTSCRLTADRNIIRGQVDVSEAWSGASVHLSRNLMTGGIAIGAGSVTQPDIFGSITDNLITGSPGHGINLGDGAFLSDFTVARNTIVGNAGDGIRLAESTYDSTYVGKVTVTRNTVVGNGGHGFNLTPTLGAVVVDGGRNRAAGNTLDPQCIGVTCS